jgi:hypothetical protein
VGGLEGGEGCTVSRWFGVGCDDGDGDEGYTKCSILLNMFKYLRFLLK